MMSVQLYQKFKYPVQYHSFTLLPSFLFFIHTAFCSFHTCSSHHNPPVYQFTPLILDSFQFQVFLSIYRMRSNLFIKQGVKLIYLNVNLCIYLNLAHLKIPKPYTVTQAHTPIHTHTHTQRQTQSESTQINPQRMDLEKSGLRGTVWSAVKMETQDTTIP